VLVIGLFIVSLFHDVSISVFSPALRDIYFLFLWHDSTIFVLTVPVNTNKPNQTFLNCDSWFVIVMNIISEFCSNCMLKILTVCSENSSLVMLLAYIILKTNTKRTETASENTEH